MRWLVAGWMLIAWSLSSAFAAQTVDGHVVNAVSGADIAGARVGLFQGDQAAYSAVADSQGRFRIENVAEGSYTARYHARGFRDIPGFLDGPGGPALQVTAGAPVHMQAKMQPLATISGTVVDSEGKPVAHAAVRVMANPQGCGEPKCFPLLKQTQTGEKGDYRIPEIDDLGPWLVSATAPSSSAMAFYPRGTDPQQGAKIQLQLGAELTNIDIRLADVPVFRVRGRVLDEHGDPVAKAAATLYNGYGPDLEIVTKDDGSFEFPKVAPGAWRLAAKLENGGVIRWAAETVRVQDHDLEKVELRISPPFTLHGRMVFETPQGVATPNSELPNIFVNHDAGEFGSDKTCPALAVGHPDEKGVFTVPVYPGPHHLDVVEAPPAQFYLDSVRLGTQDALVSDVAIQSDAQPLTVTFRFGGGTVQGSIEHCGAGRVLLLPADQSLRRHEFLHETKCGPNGQFEFSAVRPGEYLGIAVAADSSAQWYGALLDGSIFRAASKITVRANEHTTAEIRMTNW
jgi:hypothetical protein